MTQEWRFDEHHHAGEEHLDPAQVARYDEKLPFDPTSELEHLVDQGLTEEDTVVDFGTGTGVFPLAAADYCDRVVAIDVSEPMLDVAREKVDEAGVNNVDIVHDGVVSYEHEGAPLRLRSQKTYCITSLTFGKLKRSKPLETHSNRVVSSGCTISCIRLIRGTAPRRSSRGLRRECRQRSPRRSCITTSAKSSVHTTSCSSPCYRKQASRFLSRRTRRDSMPHIPANGTDLKSRAPQFARITLP